MRISALFLTLSLISISTLLHAQRDYAAQSVLSQGDWYKLAVVEDGVYRLDRSFFSNLGINLTGVDPRTIRIFGNGGGMLPQANDVFRYDDLEENAIEVVGEADGSFDGNDYVLFYAQGAHNWSYDEGVGSFTHSHHLYADTNYYYLNLGLAEGKRIAEVPSAALATFTAGKSRGFHYHEVEKENLIRSGRYWMGEKFDLITQRSFSFYTPDVDPNGKLRLRLRVAGRSDVTTTFSFIVAGKEAGRVSISSVDITNNEAIFYRSRTGEYLLDPSAVTGDSLKVLLSFSKGGSSRSEGWLDWIELDYDQQFNLRNSNLTHFALADGVGSGEIAEIALANGSGDYRIWDITNPVSATSRAYTLNGSSLSFRTDASALRRYVAFKGGFRSPAGVKKIANQSLHSDTNLDYIIIAYPGFAEAANKLAGFHETHYNRTTLVVFPEQIYNEFSCGKQDVTAIRDFIKMHYDRSGGAHPGFVCFFGDASYDYKNITQSPQRVNFVPSYESRRSDSPTTSYVSDDFYGMLDDNEGDWGEGTGSNDPYQRNLLDVAIGRLPVESAEEADLTVEKIITYATNSTSFGDWRSRVVLVADHKDGEGYTHVSQADAYTAPINQANPCINIEKVYLDNYPVLRTAGGTRFPQGREALLQQFDRGSLLVNYTGHGGEYAWSNSGILNLADIQGMENGLRQPAVVTATCEFGRFDDHDRRSGAEIFVTRPDGGAIALFTTVRLVYSSPNATLNRNFYQEVFTYDSVRQRMPTVGEIMMRTKNRTFPGGQTTDINSRNFTLLGDPGLILAYPQLNAIITKINERPIDPTLEDSLASLARVEVTGQIFDDLGNTRSDFEGDMSITVFDKPSKFLTRLAPFPFYWQTNRIFNGNASVKNGAFRFEFVVPIDVSYEEGEGKFSFYFQNAGEDGEGCYNNLYIGGTDPNAVPDDEGPRVEVYINDDKWIDGGTTGPDPYVFARVFDESGINTVASGIGHEIVGILDGDEQNVLILNDYYASEKDNYKAGTVYYQMKDLSEGEHSLTLRVWDAANNPAEGSTDFLVVSDARLALTRMLNFPNPFSPDQQGETKFLVGYNRSTSDFDLTVRILSLDGRLVKELNGSFNAGGNYNCDLSWDGRTAQGNVVGSGLYVYQIILRDQETGETVKDASKLVVVK